MFWNIANDSLALAQTPLESQTWIPGVVWKDDNRDGIQDADEPTLGGITVNLLAKDGNPIASTTTAPDGTYSFPGIDTSVRYIIEVEAPSDMFFTSSGGDSGVNPDTGRSESVNISPFVENPGAGDVNAGLVNKSGTLGDTIFKDDNGNGIQDAGEGGVEGVVVRGSYTFSVDPKQSYIIEVIEPDGFDFSPQDAGSNDAVDSDVDPTTGQTDSITVDADETDDSIDAGLVWEPGTIAGTAFKDDNQNGIQDGGEETLPGITVRLWIAGADGNLFASTDTNANGDYLFTMTRLTATSLLRVSQKSRSLSLQTKILPTSMLASSTRAPLSVIPFGMTLIVMAYRTLVNLANRM